MATGKLKIDIDVKQALGSVARLDTTFSKLDKSIASLATSFRVLSLALTKGNQSLAAISRGYTQFGSTLTNVRREFTANVRVTERANTKLAQNRKRMAALLAPTTQATSATNRFSAAQARVAKANERGSSAFRTIRTAAIAYIAALATGKLVEFADATQRIENRIRLALEPNQDINDLFGQVAESAKRSRQPLEATATAFFRIQQASKQLGIDQETALGATELFNKLLTVQGVSMHEARSALLQFSQALQSGRFQGDEFRAISEILPQILDFIAEATGRSTQELRELARQGKITPRVMLNALGGNAKEIERLFAKTNVTITQGFNILSTEISKTFRNLMQNQSTAEMIAKIFGGLEVVIKSFIKILEVAIVAVNFVLNNLLTILIAVNIQFGILTKATIVTQIDKIRNAVLALGVAFKALNAIIRANPFIMLASILLSVGFAFRDVIMRSMSLDDQIKKNDKGVKEFNVSLTTLNTILDSLAQEYGKWSQTLEQGAVQIGQSIGQNITKGIDDVSAALGRALVFGENFKQAFLNILRVVGVAIVETVTQVLVRMVLTKIIDLVTDRLTKEKGVTGQLKMQLVHLQGQRTLLETIKGKQFTQEDVDERNKRNERLSRFSQPGVMDTLLGGQRPKLGTAAITAATGNPMLGQVLGPKLDEISKGLTNELTPALEGVGQFLGGKLGTLSSITESGFGKQLTTLTQGFGGLSGLLGGGGVFGLGGLGGGIIKKATKFLGFAEGGRPPVGLPSIVGEQGPEVFVPDAAGTIVPNNQLGGTIIIQKLEILPYAQVDEALTAKPMSFWTALTQEKILPALNTLGQQGNTTTLQFRENR